MKIIHRLIHRIISAGSGIINGYDAIGVVDHLLQGVFHGVWIVWSGHSGKMRALLQQRKIPVTKFRRSLGGDFLMGQETLQEQGWIIMAQEVENFTDPETGSGIGDDIEAGIALLAQELDLL